MMLALSALIYCATGISAALKLWGGGGTSYYLPGSETAAGTLTADTKVSYYDKNWNSFTSNGTTYLVANEDCFQVKETLPVNRKEQIVYTTNSYNSFDGWKKVQVESNSGRLVLTPNGLSIISLNGNDYGDIVQHIHNFSQLIGETVTVSAIINGNKLYSYTFEYGKDVNNGWNSDDIRVYCVASYDYGVLFRFYDENTVLSAVKLELGDTQTLAHQDADGNWVLNEIPNYSEEYAKCCQYIAYNDGWIGDDIDAKTSWQTNPNLLDNWYFKGDGTEGQFPINRNGLSSYSANGAVFDRWFTTNLAVNLSADGISYNKISSDGYGMLYTEINGIPEGSAFTISLLTNVHGLNGVRATTIKSGWTYPSSSGWSGIGGTSSTSTVNTSINVRVNSNKIAQVYLYMAGGLAATVTSVKVLAAKVEIGETQTLAHIDGKGNWILNEWPSYAEQYEICSKYDSLTGKYIGNKEFTVNPNLLDNWYFEGAEIWAKAGSPYFAEAGGSALLQENTKTTGVISADNHYTIDGVGTISADYCYQKPQCLPINTKGNVVTKSSVSTFVNRWGVSLNSGAELKLSKDGLVANTTTAKMWIYSDICHCNFTTFNQQKYTYSVLIDNELFSGTGTFPEVNAANHDVYQGPKCNLYLSYSSARNCYTVGIYVPILSSNITIKAAKLEVGEIQTLAHKDSSGNWVLNEIPDAAEQAAICAQYRLKDNKFLGAVSQDKLKYCSNSNLLDNWYFEGAEIWVKAGTNYYIVGTTNVAGTFSADTKITPTKIGSSGQPDYVFVLNGGQYYVHSADCYQKSGTFPINRLGHATYNKVGDSLDIWDISTNPLYITVGNQYLHFENKNDTNAYFLQKKLQPEFLLGKTVTLSALTNEGVFSATGTVPTAIPSTNIQVARIIFNSNVHFELYYRSDNVLVAQFRLLTVTSIKIKAVKLELGNEQTLAHQNVDGNWVLNEVPSYTEQIATCIQYSEASKYLGPPEVVNKNLLDNWYFIGGKFPINRWGNTSYSVGSSTARINTIDRWTMASNVPNSTTSLSDEGLVITSAEGNTGSYTNIDQYLTGVIKPGVYTLSLLVDNQDNFGQFWIRSTSTYYPYKQDNLIYYTFTITDDNNTGEEKIGVQTVVHKTLTIKAIKLEQGYRQTLAHKDTNGQWVLNELPNYAEEYDKCIQYPLRGWTWLGKQFGSVGYNITLSSANDTPAYWAKLGNCMSYFNATGLLVDQPQQYFAVINFAPHSTTEIFQLGQSLPSGKMYHRSGNSNGWGGSWKMIHDSTSTAAELGALPISGGTMTGTIICPANYYINTGGTGNPSKSAINLMNSDIIRANTIWFQDVANDYTEGLQFPRSDSDDTFDGISAYNGILYFTTGTVQTSSTTGTRNQVYHTGKKPTPSEIGAMAAQPNKIELFPASTDNHGGYIDFHYNASTADYTSRIIESASGTINIVANLYEKNQRVYSPNNKPTPAAIGALATTGGTLTGNLAINHTSTPVLTFKVQDNRYSIIKKNANTTNDYGLQIIDYTSASSNAGLRIWDAASSIATSLQFLNTQDGTTTYYNLYGEHNKPTPSAIGAAAASKTVNATLSTSWSGSGPYTQTVTVSGITASTNGIFQLQQSATAAQVQAAMAAQLFSTAQGTNSLTITAYGDKPTIAIPLTVLILG